MPALQVPGFLELPAELRCWDRARFAVLPMPYDATCSYGVGTRNGPAALVAASHQVEWYDEELGMEASDAGIVMLCPGVRCGGRGQDPGGPGGRAQRQLRLLPCPAPALARDAGAAERRPPRPPPQLPRHRGQPCLGHAPHVGRRRPHGAGGHPIGFSRRVGAGGRARPRRVSGPGHRGRTQWGTDRQGHPGDPLRPRLRHRRPRRF